jgi:hypothetical protein
MSSATISSPNVVAAREAAPAVLTRDQVMAFIRYLVDGGGLDRLVFETDGIPDFDRARQVAEILRSQLGGYLDTHITVQQTCHRVLVCVILPEFA